MKVEEYNIGRCSVEIHTDEDGPNPRKDYDNLGTIAHWHRNYDFGDDIRDQGPVEFLKSLAREHVSVNYPESLFEKNWPSILDRHYLVLPLSLLDHSGLHMWVGSGSHFSDPGGWDSGQVGFIYCSLAKAIEEHKTDKRPPKNWDSKVEWRNSTGPKYDSIGKQIEPYKFEDVRVTLREATRSVLTSEVETYDSYLQGEVYGYVVKPEDGDEESVWGFLGEVDYVKSEAYDVATRLNEEMDEADRVAEITEKETELAEVWP